MRREQAAMTMFTVVLVLCTAIAVVTAVVSLKVKRKQIVHRDCYVWSDGETTCFPWKK